MKPNEIRVGNYAKDSMGKERTIDLSDYSYESDTTFDFEKWNPIHITSEWLLKFGLEKTGYSRWTLKGFHRLSYDIVYGNGKVILTRGESSSELFIENIQYVHQLQNLYYSLTGQELTIKQDVETPIIRTIPGIGIGNNLQSEKDN